MDTTAEGLPDPTDVRPLTNNDSFDGFPALSPESRRTTTSGGTYSSDRTPV